MSWSWPFVLEIMPSLLQGLWITFQVTLYGSLIAVPLGLVMALLRLAGVPVLSRVIGFIVEFFRGTPYLVQIYFFFYVFPEFGLTLEAMLVGALSLGLYFGAFMSEIYRTSIEAVPVGQWEASLTLGVPRWRMWGFVIMPQAFKIATPMLGNQVIVMFKESALLSTITLMELLGRGMDIAFLQFRYIEPLTMVAVLYLLVSYPVAYSLRRLENRLA